MLFGKFVVSLQPVQTLLRYPELRRGQCLLRCPGVCRGIFVFTSNHSAVSGITKKSTGKVLNSGRFLFIFVYTICNSLIINVDCGAGGTVLQNSFFKKKMEEQKVILKNEIAKDIPQIIEQAVSKSEQRIQFLYNSVIEESSKKKELWIETQKSAIEVNNKPKSIELREQVLMNIEKLEKLSSQFK